MTTLPSIPPPLSLEMLFLPAVSQKMGNLRKEEEGGITKGELGDTRFPRMGVPGSSFFGNLITGKWGCAPLFSFWYYTGNGCVHQEKKYCARIFFSLLLPKYLHICTCFPKKKRRKKVRNSSFFCSPHFPAPTWYIFDELSQVWKRETRLHLFKKASKTFLLQESRRNISRKKVEMTRHQKPLFAFFRSKTKARNSNLSTSSRDFFWLYVKLFTFFLRHFPTKLRLRKNTFLSDKYFRFRLPGFFCVKRPSETFLSLSYLALGECKRKASVPSRMLDSLLF